MSRWNKSAKLHTVVPIDNLLREKENKNSVAVGTVMKFGMMQFTSIRSSCYNMGALNSTSPIQNTTAGSPTSPSDANDSKVNTPKPRKFFKSRNAAPPAEIQQQIAMQISQQQQQQQQQQSNHVQGSQEESPRTSQKKTSVRKQPTPRKEKVVKPKVERPPKAEKPPKVKKEKPIKIKEVIGNDGNDAEQANSSDSDEVVLTRRGRQRDNENTRHSGRIRGRLVNYNEDEGEEEFIMRTEKRIAPRNLKMLQQQKHHQNQESLPAMNESTSNEAQAVQQTSDASDTSPNINHPPIVLRISKGTSRLVSTDNEDGSPNRGSTSGDENKNSTNAMKSTEELIAVLSGENSATISTIEEQKPAEQKTERIRIRIKKDYIRSYNDSLKEQEEARVKQEQLKKMETSISESTEVNEQPAAVRTTRRRGKQQQQESSQRISPIVSEFDSQSSVLGSSATTGSSNVILSDSKVIHSRGSSVVTSDIDTSQQSSLAAAPPSDSQVVSETNSMEIDDVSTPSQKGSRRGRKKNVANVEQIKPPEPVIAQPKVATRGRPARGNKVQTEPDSIAASNIDSPEKTIAVRSTRSTRNNQSNTEEERVEEKVPKFFTRKRKKNVPVEEEEQEVISPKKREEDEDQTFALNLSQKSDESASAAINTISSPNVTEYKHKKLVKRSWDQDQNTKMQKTDADHSPSKSPTKQSSVSHKQAEQSENPGVKLLISKKKGSIFKSRALEKDESENKKRNLYKHKWDAELMDVEEDTNKAQNLTTNADTSFFEGEPSGLTRFTRVKKVENKIENNANLADDFEEEEDDQQVTGLKCDRNAKNYYQVVRNVKKAHQIQEIGEFQEMDDDVEYLLDALQPNSQIALRCLSSLQLASKCMTPSFRMHIRAHGIVPKFFKALEDAPSDASLGLCTAMVMFALSQDTLKMDLDRGSLELMLNLLECEGSQKQYPKDIVMNKQHIERKQKVRELCEEIQSQGKSIHLNLDNITAAQLAMESLLSLTSKRAGEWLKEDLRELGGIEHIIKTVCDCCNQITEFVEEWSEPLLEKLNKIGRCLRILENVTSNNEANQRYILHYKSNVFVKTLCKFFQLLSKALVNHPTTDKSAKDSAAVAIRETLIPLLKVIINLTHPFNERAIGSVLFGDFKDIFQICINLLLFGVNYVWSRQQFDFSLLTLVLLSNLTQLNEKNRQSIMQLDIAIHEFGKEKQPALKSLIEYFYKCEDKAKTLKKLTDDLIDNSKQRDAKQEEAVNALIQNSGTHMENTILGSFTSTLIGFVIMNNPNNEAIARKYLRNGKFAEMVAVLMQYYEFLNLTVSADASSMAQLKTIKNVMDFLRNADLE